MGAWRRLVRDGALAATLALGVAASCSPAGAEGAGPAESGAGGRSSTAARGGSGGTSVAGRSAHAVEGGEIGGATSDSAGVGGKDEGIGGREAPGSGGTSSGRGGSAHGGSPARGCPSSAPGGSSGSDEGVADIRPPSRLALGDRHSCMLLTDCSVRCWGADFSVSYQQDSESTTDYGQVEPPDVPFTRLSAAFNATCALDSEGGAACWGDKLAPSGTDFVDLDGMNDDGFLFLRRSGVVFPGDAQTPYIRAAPGWESCFLKRDFHATCRSVPKSELPTDEFRRLTAGGSHACGVTFDGTAKCWGSNSAGQATPPAGKFADVTAGTQHTCGLRTDGSIACWGSNDHGQASPPAGPFAEVVAGPRHTCAIPLGDHDRVLCWGEGESFQTSPPTELATDAESFTRVVVGGTGTFMGMHWSEDDPEAENPASGYTADEKAGHVCGLRDDGTVRCYGTAGSTPGHDFTAISAGLSGTCGLTGAGFECWGPENVPHRTRDVANPLDGLTVAGDFTQVATGWDFACALDSEGSVACFGTGATGSTAPDATFLSVAAGGAHERWSRKACGVLTSANIVCWTFGYDDEMGTPHYVDGAFSEVAVGYATVCALDEDGRVQCFGDDYSPLPAPDEEFVHIYASQGQACAMRPNRSVTCWDVMGPLDGRILEGDFAGPFVDFSLGGDFACGLLEDGTLRCWGNYVK